MNIYAGFMFWLGQPFILTIHDKKKRAKTMPHVVPSIKCDTGAGIPNSTHL